MIDVRALGNDENKYSANITIKTKYENVKFIQSGLIYFAENFMSSLGIFSY